MVMELLAYASNNDLVNTFVELVGFNMQAFLPFFLEKIKSVFDQIEFKKTDMLKVLKRLLKFVLEDSEQVHALYWIIPN